MPACSRHAQLGLQELAIPVVAERGHVRADSVQIQGVQTGDGSFTYTRGNCTLQARGAGRRVLLCQSTQLRRRSHGQADAARCCGTVWHGKQGPLRVCRAHTAWCPCPRTSKGASAGRRGRLGACRCPRAASADVGASGVVTAWCCAESGRARGAGLPGAAVPADRLAGRAAAGHALDLRLGRARQLHVHGRCAPSL